MVYRIIQKQATVYQPLQLKALLASYPLPCSPSKLININIHTNLVLAPIAQTTVKEDSCTQCDRLPRVSSYNIKRVNVHMTCPCSSTFYFLSTPMESRCHFKLTYLSSLTTNINMTNRQQHTYMDFRSVSLDSVVAECCLQSAKLVDMCDGCGTSFPTTL